MSLVEDTMLNSWTDHSWGDGESLLGSTDMIHLRWAIIWWHFILFVMENWCSKKRYLCCGNYWTVSHAIDWNISIEISTDGTLPGCVLRAAGSGQSPAIVTIPRVNTFKSWALKQTVSTLPCLFYLAGCWPKGMKFSIKFLHKLIIPISPVLWFQAVYSSALAQQ